MECEHQADLPAVHRRRDASAYQLRKKIARRQRLPAPMAVCPNQCWAMDFMSDKLAHGRSFRIFTGVDQFTRECVALEADRSMNGAKVAAALTRPGPASGCSGEHHSG
jgi:putative transposase